MKKNLAIRPGIAARGRGRGLRAVAAHLFGEDDRTGDFDELPVFVARGLLQPEVGRLFIEAGLPHQGRDRAGPRRRATTGRAPR